NLRCSPSHHRVKTGGSSPSNRSSGSRERPSRRRQQGGSEVAALSVIRVDPTSSAPRRPLVCARPVVRSTRLDKNPLLSVSPSSLRLHYQDNQLQECCQPAVISPRPSAVLQQQSPSHP
ncbi:Peroxidase 25, partial [Dissostichus eleginoides]